MQPTPPTTQARRHPRRLATPLATLTAAAALAGCGGGAEDSPANAQPTPKVTVLVTDRGYVPSRVRIEPGTRVTFVNPSTDTNTAETGGTGLLDFDREAHDRSNLFDVHTLQPGEAESVELDTPGTYPYASSLSDIQGVIEVVEPRGS